jgi:site-specific DNA-methyltransferase (adenine-specific)
MGRLTCWNCHEQKAPKNPHTKKTKASQKSRDQAAAAVGISGKTVSAAKAIKEASPELFEKVKAGTISVAKAKKAIKAETDKKDLVTAKAQIDDEKQRDIAAVCDIRLCSCRDLFASGIQPDAVITDPPYPAEFLPVFSELAEACAAAHVPVVAVMSGQSYLPEVVTRLCQHLKYRWTIAYLTPGGQAVQQWPAKANAFWKPVFVFGESYEWFGDVAASKTNDNDKRYHGWGQSESGMADLVERLTKPGQLVCDPFVGGGTVAVVCLALGRRFVGCDIDQVCVQKARSRVLL